MPLWTWAELCGALALPMPEKTGPNVQGISIDSRTTVPGDLFVALAGDPGPRFNVSYRSGRDGHDFIPAAAAEGAVGALVHRASPAAELPTLQVADTLEGLWQLGRAARTRLACPVIAVTGSSGKTTCKSFLAAALNGFATVGSLNNHLGVPLSLARTPRNATAAVYEIGMNHPGEIAPLAALVQPDVAVVLNVQDAHRENFPDPDGIRQEKLSICAGLRPGGVLVVESSVGVDDVRPDVRIVRFGRGADCDVELLAMDDGRARYRVGASTLTAHVPGGSAHRALTLAAVLAVTLALGLDPEPATRLSDALVPAGRGGHYRINGRLIIDDSYNANPASMAAALRALRATDAKRRIAVLGEMLELGPGSDACHRELAPLCAGFDHVVCVGAGTLPLQQTLQDAPGETLGAAVGTVAWSSAADENLLTTLLALSEPGDAILIKGSNRVFWQHAFVSRLLEALQRKQ
jgi:UDP-N-acetylmuramoyl-tripeptide--D-alanyl-D-alanine ligase